MEEGCSDYNSHLPGEMKLSNIKFKEANFNTNIEILIRKVNYYLNCFSYFYFLKVISFFKS